MSIFSISSYREYLEKHAAFFFDITIKSVQFYTKFFGHEYPFSKLDQVWVHEFKSGAMENAGIVTYNDSTCLPKDTPTSSEAFEIADTITHEISHHWFGNLVTMRWWDDLWLNESFADYISYFCLLRINQSLVQPFDNAMAYFRDRKRWGYMEDKRNATTHPIRDQVTST